MAPTPVPTPKVLLERMASHGASLRLRDGVHYLSGICLVQVCWSTAPKDTGSLITKQSWLKSGLKSQSHKIVRPGALHMTPDSCCLLPVSPGLLVCTTVGQ